MDWKTGWWSQRKIVGLWSSGVGHPDSKSDCNGYISQSHILLYSYIYIYIIYTYIYIIHPLKLSQHYIIDYHIPIPLYPYQTEKDYDICSVDPPLEKLDIHRVYPIPNVVQIRRCCYSTSQLWVSTFSNLAKPWICSSCTIDQSIH